MPLRAFPVLADCPCTYPAGLRLEPVRAQSLLLCRCGQSQRLPYCDGGHNPPVPGLKAKWRRFWSGACG
ncbi:CDGSH iron-sulfur domain-containing protein [Pseudomonas borbori]|uniref:CDGSH iron-sulfur domain-containing protein n=1 Tax=Pseudomonas borbori TaxID=289003 RepID=UPI00313A4428